MGFPEQVSNATNQKLEDVVVFGRNSEDLLDAYMQLLNGTTFMAWFWDFTIHYLPSNKYTKSDFVLKLLYFFIFDFLIFRLAQKRMKSGLGFVGESPPPKDPFYYAQLLSDTSKKNFGRTRVNLLIWRKQFFAEFSFGQTYKRLKKCC